MIIIVHRPATGTSIGDVAATSEMGINHGVSDIGFDHTTTLTIILTVRVSSETGGAAPDLETAWMITPLSVVLVPLALECFLTV